MLHSPYSPIHFSENLPISLRDLDHHLIDRSLDLPDPPNQTASRSPHPFFQNSRSLPTDRQTDRTKTQPIPTGRGLVSPAANTVTNNDFNRYKNSKMTARSVLLTTIVNYYCSGSARAASQARVCLQDNKLLNERPLSQIVLRYFILILLHLKIKVHGHRKKMLLNYSVRP